MLVKETILCGRCVVPPEFPKHRRPKDEVRCETCGQKDTLENVLDEARKYATHHAALMQDREYKAQGRQIKEFTPKRAPFKSRRWITGVLDRVEGSAKALSKLSH